MNNLTFDKNTFYIDGKPFRMIAGDVHYFRIHQNDWANRLDLAVDFGLNTIQTYVPWNAHEPHPGKYNFEGMLNLGEFLRLCGEKGLRVLLRPTPYICSEWDLGGLPSWLLKDRDITLRSSDPTYLTYVKKYYERLIPEFLPYLATNGGPVIAVAIENEYGSYGNDKKYLKAVEQMLIDGGVNVPFYTTDGDRNYMLTFGRASKDNFFGVNYRANVGTSEHAAKISRLNGENMPYFVGEFWAGRAMQWGEPFKHRPPAQTSEGFREALQLGGHVCFYMFSGGSNFGFMGGADYGTSFASRPGDKPHYMPQTTSYDVDALISEDGRPTEKYFLCRDMLDEYLGREKRPHVAPARETQALSVNLAQSASLFDNLDVLTEKHEYAVSPKPMEYYGQNYGLILYSTTLEAFEEIHMRIQPHKFNDRANIYVDGEWFATYMRDKGCRGGNKAYMATDGIAALAQSGNERRIDVLVENLGRINYGKLMGDERKGLDGCLLYGGVQLFGYDTRTIPLENLSSLEWKSNTSTDHSPTFFKGEFDAKSGVDTYVCFDGFGHGYIWINGFNLGRYDSAGPQMTLYLPGHFLKDSGNEIIVLDIDPTGDRSKIELLDHEILEGESLELS